MSALVDELHGLGWHPTTGSCVTRTGCELTEARSDLAAEELLLRVPGLDLPRRFLMCDAQHTKHRDAMVFGNPTQMLEAFGCGLRWALPAPMMEPGSELSAIEDTMARLSLGDAQPNQVPELEYVDHAAERDAAFARCEALEKEEDEAEDKADAERVESMRRSSVYDHRKLARELANQRVAPPRRWEGMPLAYYLRDDPPVLEVATVPTTITIEAEVMGRENYVEVALPFRTQTLRVSDDGPFEVWQAVKEFDLSTTLDAMVCELNGSVTFERLLAKFTYCVRQRVPPIGTDPGFEKKFKVLIAKHRAASGSMCLTAQELDQLDLVLGRVTVKRCSVCFKPTDGREFHKECADVITHCIRCDSSDFRSVCDTILSECLNCKKPSWPIYKPGSGGCRRYAHEHLKPRAVSMPGSSKVSRKRVASP